MRFGTNSPGKLLVVLGFAALSACKKDAPAVPPPPPPPPAATYTVGGTLSGLTGSITLANNGGDAKMLTTNGTFSFATALATGAAYSVTVTAKPATQTCTVASGAGTLAAGNISNVTVTCVTNTFTVGGAVTGLAGSGLVLQNNAGDNLTRAADGAFTFATAVASGGAYNVTVLSQPATPAQTCTPTNNSGNVAANVTNVTITCVTNPTSVGSAVIGPAGGTVNGVYGAQIIVPPGALAMPVTIGIARDSSNSPAFAVTDVDAVGAIFELTPHGQTFAVPVTVRVPFDAAQVANDADPTLYKAEMAGAFGALTTTVNGNFLEATVTNFSWLLPGAAATKPRMVYAVANAAGTLSLASYRINRTTGGLSTATSSAAVGDFPTSVVAHPSGRFLYVTNAGSTTTNGIAPNSVSVYGLSSINGQIAGLGSTSATRAPPGYKPTMPVVHPSGKFLYVINFGSVSSNSGGDIDVFDIDGSKGLLTLSGNAISGNGSQPMGIAFNRLGTRAYVLFDGATLSNPLDSRVALYDVDPATGAFAGPVSTVAATAPGNHSWAIAIDPNGKALYVANLISNEVVTFGINSTTGLLNNLGSLSVRDKPAALAMDSFGRFTFAVKQQPFFNVNALSFLMDATTGVLSAAGSALSGCPGGACVGPISMITEPQGDFAYVVDSVGGLTAFAVNQQTGALSTAGSSTGAWVPAPGGIGFPFTFAASGVSPVWQPNCTQGCGLVGVLTSSGNGGSGGGTPPGNPNPPTSHYLSVTQGAFFGFVTSSPAGIDYGPATNLDPIAHNVSANHFPANSTVQLCTSEPPQPQQGYDQHWSGSCSGNGQCASVTMTSDKYCNVTFTPVSLR
ncbi:MAG TPA: beta-propeller fold lactonase family protein [Steroidobacteraceae bacterium]|jgi:6-phosphogluconolactonase (cycloisomerase 2 family)|nr:beta-propeller fold lactonase family protein [Steroidobacteraceae bacterium]